MKRHIITLLWRKKGGLLSQGKVFFKIPRKQRLKPKKPIEWSWEEKPLTRGRTWKASYHALEVSLVNQFVSRWPRVHIGPILELCKTSWRVMWPAARLDSTSMSSECKCRSRITSFLKSPLEVLTSASQNGVTRGATLNWAHISNFSWG